MAAPAAANICMIAFLAFAAFFPRISPGVASMASFGFLASGATQLAIAMELAHRLSNHAAVSAASSRP